jgi:bifunctional non-homologous end joining protein LigD
VAQEFGLEGLVAKKRNSVYESGQRNGTWVKFKITKSQEFVIGGYTLPEGNRKYFESLLVGYQRPDGFLFTGRVGTGFSEKLLASIDAQLQKIRRAACPFINLPEKSKGRWGLGITPVVMQRCQWVKHRTDCSGQVCRVDARRPASSTGVPWATNRQGGQRRRSRINRARIATTQSR